MVRKAALALIALASLAGCEKTEWTESEIRALAGDEADGGRFDPLTMQVQIDALKKENSELRSDLDGAEARIDDAEAAQSELTKKQLSLEALVATMDRDGAY